MSFNVSELPKDFDLSSESYAALESISKDEVISLIEELYTAADAYYQKGIDSGLSDEVFDAKVEHLNAVNESDQHPELFTVGTKGFLILEGDPSLGTKTKSDEAVTHDAPMLSLGKAKKQSDLLSFLSKARKSGASDFRLQAKLDGLAISARYNNGVIDLIATRGDGVQGDDATYILDDPNVTVVGLPRTVSNLGVVEVRGELFFTTTQFEAADDARFKLTAERFKNSRNAAAGLMKKAKGGVDYPVEFTFATYSVLQNKEPANLDSLVDEESIVTVDELTEESAPDIRLTGFENDDEILRAVEDFGKIRSSIELPTDGVVIKPTNESEMNKVMGFTSHHPVSQIAWKYPAENAKTVVLGIDITVGKTGRLTPVARIAPVDLDGSIVSNASLHNFNLIATKDIRVGSVVLVEKANDIIPQVTVVINNPAETVEVVVPTNCPSCDSVLVGEMEGKLPPKTLGCPNVICPSRDFFALKSAVGKDYFDIDGLSEVALTYLNEIGRVKNVADLFTLTESELANSTLGVTPKGTPRRMGEKRAVHILNYIEKSKTKPLAKILPALNIDLLGRTAAKKLEKAFGDVDGILNASESDIGSLDGFGPIGAEKIYRGLKLRTDLINTLREHGVTFGKIETNDSEYDESDSALSSSTAVDLSGVSFAISGSVPAPFANRGAWVDFIEENGGIFHSAPKASTTYMVGDNSDGSSKIQKAVKLGIEFLNATEFSEKYC